MPVNTITNRYLRTNWYWPALKKLISPFTRSIVTTFQEKYSTSIMAKTSYSLTKYPSMSLSRRTFHPLPKKSSKRQLNLLWLSLRTTWLIVTTKRIIKITILKKRLKGRNRQFNKLTLHPGRDFSRSTSKI